MEDLNASEAVRAEFHIPLQYGKKEQELDLRCIITKKYTSDWKQESLLNFVIHIIQVTTYLFQQRTFLFVILIPISVCREKFKSLA